LGPLDILTLQNIFFITLLTTIEWFWST